MNENRGTGVRQEKCAQDVILPLHVPLEQLVCGAIRHIQVNRQELKRAGFTLLQDSFEVTLLTNK